MAPPPGVLQRAVLVALPLALVVLIFVTPVLMGRQASPTAIPSFRANVVTADAGPDQALLYVWSPLGVTEYYYLAINASGGGNYTGTQWSVSGVQVPSLWLKFPVNATRIANVTAVAIDKFSVYRFNATLEFRFNQGWVVRVTPEAQTSFSEYPMPFSTPMRREARP